MAYLDRNPPIDEYARLKAENEAELLRLKMEESFRNKTRSNAARLQQAAADSRYFERHFHTLVDERPAPVRAETHDSPEEIELSNFEYANFYYFTNN